MECQANIHKKAQRTMWKPAGYLYPNLTMQGYPLKVGNRICPFQNDSPMGAGAGAAGYKLVTS